jgi:hypothetical protein
MLSYQQSSGQSDQPDALGATQLTFVKTSAWLLSQSDRPPFRVVGDATSTDSAKSEPAAPVLALLNHILADRLPGKAWLAAADRASRRMLPFVPADQARPLISQLRGAIINMWDKTRDRPWSASPDRALRDELAPLRHRVFLDADRFEGALLDAQRAFQLQEMRRGGTNYHIVLDLKFFYLLSQLRCHVSLSIWSELPTDKELCPEELRGAPAVRSTIDVHTYRNMFLHVAATAHDMLEEHGFIPADGTIGDGAHGLPVFWIVTPGKPNDRPMAFLKEGNSAQWKMTNRLAQTFLKVGTVRDSLVSHSVLNGYLVTLRRPEDGSDGVRVPHYLMILGKYPSARRNESPMEQNIADVITKLTDLEAEGSSRIISIKGDLEIWHNHLRVYNVVAERATFLWDAISTHLPIRRRSQLDDAHRAVELIHQFLLQTVGDLGHIAALIRQAGADIEDVVLRVSGQYDSAIMERHLAEQTGVRAALTQTGLFAQTRREAQDVAAEADRVKQACDDLLQIISHAFEERRVREADVLQKYGILFSIFLGLGILIEVLDATVKNLEGTDLVSGLLGKGLPGIASNFIWFTGVVFTLFLLRMLWRFRSVGKLGSREFRRLYDGPRYRRVFGRWKWLGRLMAGFGKQENPRHGVWQVMKDISTDRLERESEKPEHEGPPTWESLDRQLAEAYATTWDAVTAMGDPKRSDHAGDDIKALAGKIEQWGMHSLLLTERARSMYQYPLPALTCLFRCSDRIKGSFLQLGYLKTRTSMLATEDLNRSLARLKFRPDEIGAIDRWLTSREYENAKEALGEILSILAPAQDAQQADPDRSAERDQGPGIPRARRTVEEPVVGQSPS